MPNLKNTDYKVLRKKVLRLHPAQRRYFWVIMRGRAWTRQNCYEAIEMARTTKPSKCDEALGWFSPTNNEA